MKRTPRGWLILVWVEIMFFAYLAWWLKGCRIYDVYFW